MTDPIPLYESAGDRVNETQIATLLIRKWRCDRALKLAMAYGLDYALQRSDRIVAFAECKHRDLGFGVPGGYYISLLKAMRADALTSTTGLPCLLVVRFSDGLVRWANFDNACPVIEHGRHDRPGDPLAIEPCVVFDWRLFQLLHDADEEIHF